MIFIALAARENHQQKALSNSREKKKYCLTRL